MAGMAGSISSLVVGCLREFSQTEQLLSSHKNEVPSTLWSDELGRLRIWAANVGAHQTGLSSLDYRLRDASHIKEQVLRLLNRLQRACTDIRDVLGDVMADDGLSDSGSEGVNEEDEMQMIYSSIRDTINCLFQMSMVIRRPSHHDQFLGTRKSDTAHFEPYDRQHVSNKYPEADEKIIARLARGISERRAFLRYRQRHQEKLAHGLDRVVADEPDTGSTKPSVTVATNYVEASGGSTGLDGRSDITQTSYAQTLLQGQDGIMTVPPLPPQAADGGYFECPYCFYIVTITNMRAWARHVFNDLMPYICVFPDCATPQRLYGSRHEWTSHTQQAHPQKPKDSCPLCSSPVGSGPNMEKHLARHLEELALFALPRPDSGDDTGSGVSKQSVRSDTLLRENLDIDWEESMSFYPDTAARVNEDGLDSDRSPSEIGSNGETGTSLLPATDQHSTSSLKGEHDRPDLGEQDEYPDIIILKHRQVIYEVQLPAYSISEGNSTIGRLRRHAAEILQVSASRLNLIYKGKLLDNDSLPCRTEGLKHQSEVLCVVSEYKVGARSESSDTSSTEGQGRPPKTEEAPIKEHGGLVDLKESGRVSYASYPPAPGLDKSAAAILQIRSLSSYFHQQLVPLCDTFLRITAFDDDKARDFGYKNLSEFILMLMLKVDGVEPTDHESRDARRALIKEAQSMLNALDQSMSSTKSDDHRSHD